MIRIFLSKLLILLLVLGWAGGALASAVSLETDRPAETETAQLVEVATLADISTITSAPQSPCGDSDCHDCADDCSLCRTCHQRCQAALNAFASHAHYQTGATRFAERASLPPSVLGSGPMKPPRSA